MTNIYVGTLGVPRIPRNKRIYQGITQTTRTTGVQPIPIVQHFDAKILKYDDGDFTTREVEISFGSPFYEIPVGDVKCYRYEAREGGGLFYTNVVFYVEDVDWLTPDGFKIIIEDYESLSGVYVEYLYTERTEES